MQVLYLNTGDIVSLRLSHFSSHSHLGLECSLIVDFVDSFVSLTDSVPGVRKISCMQSSILY